MSSNCDSAAKQRACEYGALRLPVRSGFGVITHGIVAVVDLRLVNTYGAPSAPPSATPFSSGLMPVCRDASIGVRRASVQGTVCSA